MNYTRIDRKNLLIDTNTKESGSLPQTLDNPIQLDSGAYLLSRIGYAGSIQDLTPGYCIRFDNSNSSLYIKTKILSSEMDNYDIIIHGEGNKNILHAYAGNETIRIIQNEELQNDEYFNLSYIVFINKATGKIDHLFECEEGSGNQLYDAVTGNIATLESVSNITNLRTTSKVKEWIYDKSNIENACHFNGAFAYIPNSSRVLQTLPLSISFTYDVDNWEDASENNSIMFINSRSYNAKENDDAPQLINAWKCGLSIYYNVSNSRLFITYGNKDQNTELSQCYYTFENSGYRTATKTFLNGLPLGKHKINVIFTKDIYTGTGSAQDYTIIPKDDETTGGILGTRVYIDGELVFRNNYSNVTWGNVYSPFLTNPADSYILPWGLIGFSAQNYTPASGGYGNIANDYFSYITLSNIVILSGEMDSNDSEYTIEDYNKDKIVPYNYENLILNLDNISKDENIWLDRSLNNHNAIFNSKYNTEFTTDLYSLPNKNYGTWCNNVGYSEYTDFFSPSNFDTNLSLTGGTGWKWGNFRNQYYQLSVIDDIDIKISNTSSINTSYELLWWGHYNNAYTQRRIDCKKIIFKIDDLELSDSLISKISVINSVMMDVKLTYITDFSQTTGTIIEFNSQTRKYYNEIKNGNTLWEIDVPNEAVAVVGMSIGFYTPNSFMWDSSDYFVYKNPRLYLKDFQDINLKYYLNTYNLNKIFIPRKVNSCNI